MKNLIQILLNSQLTQRTYINHDISDIFGNESGSLVWQPTISKQSFTKHYSVVTFQKLGTTITIKFLPNYTFQTPLNLRSRCGVT